MAATTPQASMQTLDMSEDTVATEQSPSRWFEKLIRVTMVITIVSILVGAVVSVGMLIVQTIWPSDYSTACNSTVSSFEIKLDLIFSRLHCCLLQIVLCMHMYKRAYA